MNDTGSLVAQRQDSTTWHSGINLIDDAATLYDGVQSGSWVEGGLGMLGTGLDALMIATNPIGTLISYGLNWLIEHVKPLQEALNRLAGDGDQVAAYAQTWKNVARAVQQAGQDMGQAVNTQTTGWTGDAADAYRQLAVDKANHLLGASTAANTIGSAVEIVGMLVGTVRMMVRDIVTQAIGDIVQYALEEVFSLGIATPVVAAQVSTAVASWMERISALVRRLTNSIARLRPLMSKLEEIWATIKRALTAGERTADNLARDASKLHEPAPHVTETPHVTEPSATTTTPAHTTEPAHVTEPPTTTQPHEPTPTTTHPNGTEPVGTHPETPGTRPSEPQPNGIRDNVENPRECARPNECLPGSGDPIDSLTGMMFLPQTDVELGGVLPLVLTRTHRSTYRAGRFFGSTWTSTFDQRLELEADGVYVADAGGVLLVYPHPVAPETPVFAAEGPRWPLVLGADGAYRLSQLQNGTTLHFAAPVNGRSPIAAVTDRNGHRIDFHYAASGMPAAVEHSGGYRIDVRTEAGHITALALRNPDGEDISLVRYGYQGDRLVEVSNSSGRGMRFDYDQAGRVTRWEDGKGQWYRFLYDGAGRCHRTESSGDALAGTLDIDTENRVSVWTDSLGARTTYHFNEARQAVRIVDALGGETRQEWDPYDRLLARTDPLGRTTRWEYDEAGNITAITRPDGTRSLAEYNEFAERTTVVDPDGAVWRNSYDARGNLTEAVDPAGALTRYGYDRAGHLVAITDELGNTRLIEPNAAGLPVAVTDPTGALTRFVRDVFGRVTTIIDPLGAMTRFVWSIEGKPISRVKPDGSVDHWRYDAQGAQVEHRDAVGRVSRVETTHFDLASATITADGTRIEYAYDSELRLVAVTNPQGLMWRYDYDALGRLLNETDFNGSVTRYVYDAAGQLAERTNAAGQRVRYVRDAMGRIVERHTDAGVSTYQHDPAGRLRRAISPAATLELDYDPLGRITAETVNGRTLRSEFDAAGRRIRRITPTGAVSVWDYDGNHRPAVLRTGGRTLTFGFDAAGRELERLLDTGVAITQAWDNVDQLIAQTVVRQGVPVQRRGYRYLPSGYPDAIEGPGGARRFELDALDRIVGAHGAGPDERYAYDAAGNITAAAWSTGDPDEQGARDYTGTLIQRAGNLSYRHDAQGRVVLRHKRRLTAAPQTWQYAWDADDRLTGVTTPDGTRWSYLYDPIGRRIAKLRLSGDGVGVAERVDFVWDGDAIAEQIHSGGAATTWDYQPGNRRPLVQLERVRSAAQGWIDERFYSIVTDLVGAPSELIDPAGTLVWQARSTVWGAAAGGGTPLRFPGQYHDAETGLHYNVFRYYDPAAGRYLSGDPLGLAPAPNPHAYVPNPMVWADPLGLAKYKCVQAGQTGAYSDLSPGTPGDALEAHHMPQKAMGFTSEADGGAIVLPRDEHVDTRTWGSRGAQTATNEAGMSFRDVLARDMWDIRRIANDFHGSPGYYNQSLRELLEYYRTNFPGLINKP